MKLNSLPGEIATKEVKYRQTSTAKHNYRRAFIGLIFHSLIFHTSGGSCALEPDSFAASLRLIRDASASLWPKPGRNSVHWNILNLLLSASHLLSCALKSGTGRWIEAFQRLLLPYIEMPFHWTVDKSWIFPHLWCNTATNKNSS